MSVSSPIKLVQSQRVRGFKGSSENAKGRKTTMDYIRMLYISYGAVCELETQILLAGDLDLIEKSELGTLKKDIAEIERMLKALIKALENKPLNPGPLESLDPLLQLNWKRTISFYFFPIHDMVLSRHEKST